MYKLRIEIEIHSPDDKDKEQFKQDFERWMQSRPPTVIAEVIDPGKKRIPGGPPRETQAALALSSE